MGDILHALPAATALRQAHPEWHLGWAVEPQWRALLRADSAGGDAGRGPLQPLVDAVHPVPAKAWGRAPLRPATLRSILNVRSTVRDAGYDAAADLQGAVRSAVVARWARTPRLLGEAVPREPAARFLFRERIPSRGVHVIEQAADVLRALNGDALPLTLPLTLPLLPSDPVAARWVRDAGVEEGFILLHPGAGWGAKRWPVERYAEAGALLHKETGAKLVINAAPGETALGSVLLAQLRAARADAALLTPTVGQLIELTRLAALAIGGDTGPLHLAAALGKPTVGIFGPTDPARNGPFHSPFRVLRDPSSRRDHTRRAEPEPGLLRIAAAEVAEAALPLMAGRAEVSA